MKAAEPFIDEADLTAIAGDGGDGCVSFRHEKYVPLGGPNGGNGGRGGDVVLQADQNLGTLRDQQHRPVVRGEHGAAGSTGNRTGRSGTGVIVRVPVGTQVFESDQTGTRSVLTDLANHGDVFLIARGGRGGIGNGRFSTPTRQTPDFATDGKKGERRTLQLSLKLLADVGLVGLPNAGKSTILSAISKAHPKVASYPFTTLIPSLGVVEVDEMRFVVADIPGLIEGASVGSGLGDRFLRHIERTRVLVHIIDAGRALTEGSDVLSNYEIVRKELATYDKTLLERVEVVVLNKIDLLSDQSLIDDCESDLRNLGCCVVRTSGATHEGLSNLLQNIAISLVKRNEEEEMK